MTAGPVEGCACAIALKALAESRDCEERGWVFFDGKYWQWAYLVHPGRYTQGIGEYATSGDARDAIRKHVRILAEIGEDFAAARRAAAGLSPEAAVARLIANRQAMQSERPDPANQTVGAVGAMGSVMHPDGPYEFKARDAVGETATISLLDEEVARLRAEKWELKLGLDTMIDVATRIDTWMEQALRAYEGDPEPSENEGKNLHVALLNALSAVGAPR